MKSDGCYGEMGREEVRFKDGVLEERQGTIIGKSVPEAPIESAPSNLQVFNSTSFRRLLHRR